MENQDAKDISEAFARLSQENADYKAIEAVRANNNRKLKSFNRIFWVAVLAIAGGVVGYGKAHAIEVPHNRVIERQVIKSNHGEQIIIEIIAKDEAKRALGLGE